MSKTGYSAGFAMAAMLGSMIAHSTSDRKRDVVLRRVDETKPQESEPVEQPPQVTQLSHKDIQALDDAKAKRTRKALKRTNPDRSGA